MLPSNKTTTIIQFTKSPEGDQVKTRLSAALNIEQRLKLHKFMTQWSFRQALLSAADNIVIAVDGNEKHEFFNSLYECTVQEIVSEGKNLNKCEYKSYAVIKQQGNDLGEKMFFAANAEMTSNPSGAAVILIGSDCPFVTVDYLNAAIDALQSAPVVVGPANDGGYVLLGMTKIIPKIFEDISWGTSKVFVETQQALHQGNHSFRVLPSLNDIDRPEDLELLGSKFTFL